MNNKQSVFQIALRLFVVTALFSNCNAGDNFRDEFNFYDQTFWVKATHGIGACKFKPENTNIVDGKLVLTVRDIPSWEGGELYSKNRFHYGSYRTRLKAAPGKGVVSAFFTYYYRSDNYNHEIDFEFFNNSYQVCMTTWTAVAKYTSKVIDVDFDATADFHEYRFDWYEDRVEFYIDRDSVWTSTTNIPRDSCTVRANNWIARWLGTPDIPNHETKAYYDYISYTSFATGVKEILFDRKASDFTLGPNYPNPFNPITKIPYYLNKAGYTKLVIYNLMGQRIRVLINTTKSSGCHNINWDGRDENGRIVPAGVYIYRLQKDNSFKLKKMILLR